MNKRIKTDFKNYGNYHFVGGSDFRRCIYRNVSRGGSYIEFHRKLMNIHCITMEYKGDYGNGWILGSGRLQWSGTGEICSWQIAERSAVRNQYSKSGMFYISGENEESDGYLFGRNFDLNASPGMFVRTQPEDGYASISMVNLGFIGYGEEKLPDSMKDALLTLAAPYAR